MSATLQQQLSAERAALIAALTPRSWAIGGSGHHTVSAIHWRGPYLIGPAEALGDVEQVRLYAPPATPPPVDTRADEASVGEREGEVVAVDLPTDVAVIRVSGAPAIGQPTDAPQSEPLKLGESVAIVGRDWHAALATWSSVRAAGPAWRSRRGGQIDQRLEFAAEVDGRWEGALVATTEGRIAAMMVRGPRGRPLGIPTSTIERVIGRVERHGYLPRPYLGLRLQALWLDAAAAARLARRSVRICVVAGVDPDSPAAAAGLMPGDLIDRIDEHEVDGVDGLRDTLVQSTVGQTLRLGLLRGGIAELRTLSVAERPRP